MNQPSGRVATKLLFENGRIRIWEMSLNPGEASDWHSHTHDYVFVNLAPREVSLQEIGREAQNRTLDDGFVEYTAVGPGGQPAHQLVNAGEKPLRQVLVEFLGSNTPTHGTF